MRSQKMGRAGAVRQRERSRGPAARWGRSTGRGVPVRWWSGVGGGGRRGPRGRWLLSRNRHCHAVAPAGCRASGTRGTRRSPGDGQSRWRLVHSERDAGIATGIGNAVAIAAPMTAAPTAVRMRRMMQAFRLLRGPCRWMDRANRRPEALPSSHGSLPQAHQRPQAAHSGSEVAAEVIHPGMHVVRRHAEPRGVAALCAAVLMGQYGECTGAGQEELLLEDPSVRGKLEKHRGKPGADSPDLGSAGTCRFRWPTGWRS